MRFFFLLLFLLCNFAFGQINDRRRVETEAFRKEKDLLLRLDRTLWKKNPLFASPIIGIKQLGYDSNIFSSTEESEVDDFSASPMLGIDTFWRPSNTWIWNNQATVNYLWYKDTDNLNGTEWGYSSKLHGIFKKLYVMLGFSQDKDRSRINSEIDSRVKNKRTNMSLEATFQPVPRHNIRLAHQRYELEFESDEDLYVRLNREETTSSCVYLFEKNPHFWPLLELETGEAEFATVENPRNADFDKAWIGIQNETGTRIKYSAKLGMSSMDFKNEFSSDGTEITDVDELIGRFSAKYEISRKSFVESGIQRGTVFSQSNNYTHYIFEKLDFRYGFRLKRDITLGPTITLATNNYDRAISQDVTEIREDDIQRLGIHIKFPLLNTLEWQLELGYQERDSNLPNAKDEGITFLSEIRYR